MAPWLAGSFSRAGRPTVTQCQRSLLSSQAIVHMSTLLTKIEDPKILARGVVQVALDPTRGRDELFAAGI